MKTNPALRTLVKLRVILGCAALAAIVGLELYYGASFAARIGQTTTRQTDGPPIPNMDLGDLMSAGR